MTPELKRYYLMQASYWCQQLIVLVLRLEKPRKDYKELVAHHIVTLWLIGFVSGLCTLVLVYSHSCSQVELRHQPHAHRECCICLHGCPRLFLRNG
jgi:TLC domain